MSINETFVWRKLNIDLKMKYLVVLFVCAFTATALADAEINQSTFEAGRNRIMEMSRTCDENPATAVDQKALEKYLESNGPDPANAGVHALCITKNLSWQNEDGSVNKSLITEKVKAIFGGVDAKIERYIEDCTEAKAKPEDTAEQLLNCYRKHSPKTE
ncbi:hypothetical protein HUJ04_008147 [Dendroctonus ponderosae]